MHLYTYKGYNVTERINAHKTYSSTAIPLHRLRAIFNSDRTYANIFETFTPVYTFTPAVSQEFASAKRVSGSCARSPT